MGIRQYKPTTPGRRQGTVSDFSDLTYPKKNRPEKSLLEPKPKKGGRNNQGIITSRFRGGGHKRMYRVIDFKRRKDGIAAKVPSASSTTPTARPYCPDPVRGRRQDLHPAPQGLSAGDRIMSGNDVEPRVGNCMPLRKVPPGMSVHNVELQPGRGGQLCRMPAPR